MSAINPLAKIAATLIVALAVVASVDWVSAATALAAELLLLPALRLPWRGASVRALPVLVAAVLACGTTVLYGRTSGRIYAHWLLAEVSSGSVSLGVATGLRILAIGVPAVLMFTTIDATELADGLGQLLRLPARFVIGALAAFRLSGLLADDWRALTLARRARGVADSGRLRRVAGQTFGLLVLSIRRGSTLATAMEARGFGAPGPRSWARPSVFATREWIVVAAGAVVAALAVVLAVATGEWRFLGR